ncbi:MAG TPA: hypothetical protein DCK87_02610 [Desulfotomaculum sp.]|nr:hypothetical protein [Desulfotomaculum sp.]
MAYYVSWEKRQGKNKIRRYASLMEKIPVPGGINSRWYCYLGKEPLTAIRKLYQEGKLTMEQVENISERRLPELADLKEELRKEACRATGQAREADHHAQGDSN